MIPTKDAIKNQEMKKAILLDFNWEEDLKNELSKKGLK